MTGTERAIRSERRREGLIGALVILLFVTIAALVAGLVVPTSKPTEIAGSITRIRVEPASPSSGDNIFTEVQVADGRSFTVRVPLGVVCEVGDRAIVQEFRVWLGQRYSLSPQSCLRRS